MTQPHSKTPWWGNALDGLPSSFTLRLAKFQQLARQQFDLGMSYDLFHRTVLHELFCELFAEEQRDAVQESVEYVAAVMMCVSLMPAKPDRTAIKEPEMVLYVRVPKSLAITHYDEANRRNVSGNTLAICKLLQPSTSYHGKSHERETSI